MLCAPWRLITSRTAFEVLPMTDTATTAPTGGEDFSLPRGTPASVRRWYEIHLNEGVRPRLALYRALERASADGGLSDSMFSRLEAVLRDVNGRLDLS